MDSVVSVRSLTLQLAHGGGLALMGVRTLELGGRAPDIGNLFESDQAMGNLTPGLEVEKLTKVDPVGGLRGLCFDLYLDCLGGGTYSLGIRL